MMRHYNGFNKETKKEEIQDDDKEKEKEKENRKRETFIQSSSVNTNDVISITAHPVESQDSFLSLLKRQLNQINKNFKTLARFSKEKETIIINLRAEKNNLIKIIETFVYENSQGINEAVKKRNQRILSSKEYNQRESRSQEINSLLSEIHESKKTKGILKEEKVSISSETSESETSESSSEEKETGNHFLNLYLQEIESLQEKLKESQRREKDLERALHFNSNHEYEQINNHHHHHQHHHQNENESQDKSESKHIKKEYNVLLKEHNSLLRKYEIETLRHEENNSLLSLSIDRLENHIREYESDIRSYKEQIQSLTNQRHETSIEFTNYVE